MARYATRRSSRRSWTTATARASSASSAPPPTRRSSVGRSSARAGQRTIPRKSALSGSSNPPLQPNYHFRARFSLRKKKCLLKYQSIFAVFLFLFIFVLSSLNIETMIVVLNLRQLFSFVFFSSCYRSVNCFFLSSFPNKDAISKKKLYPFQIEMFELMPKLCGNSRISNKIIWTKLKFLAWVYK